LECRPSTPRELASLGVGLDVVDVTPLHAALLAAAVGNDGQLPAPRLVVGSCGPLGLADRPDAPGAARPVLDAGTAARLSRAMVAVAERGTGAGLAPPGFAIAMKTGTAATPGLGYHVNYVGVAPLPEASVAFCVRVTGPRSSAGATAAGREVLRRLLAGLAGRRPRLRALGRSAPGR
jgi:peptidoglycan glycosyltransferase